MASDPAALVDILNEFGLNGSMSPQMRGALIASVAAIPASNPLGRLRNAIYLLATSPQYLVER
jgi:hypothetical protein